MRLIPHADIRFNKKSLTNSLIVSCLYCHFNRTAVFHRVDHRNKAVSMK